MCKDCYVYDEKTGRGTWNSAAYKMARIVEADCTSLECIEAAEEDLKTIRLIY